MHTRAKIALSVSDSERTDRYFSLYLKEKLCNEPVEYSQPNKVFVVSGIASDFHGFCKVLVKYGIVDKRLKWTFGDGHLVIVGNSFNISEQVVECLWFIYSLEEKSQKEGGYVHFILGNSEIMSLNGEWRHRHPKYAGNSKSHNIPYVALYDGNNELLRWICTKNIIEKIGKMLFVHGGISQEINQLPFNVSEINNLARPHYTTANRLSTDPLLYAIFNSEQSPIWYQGYYTGEATETQVRNTLAKFGISVIITGQAGINQVNNYYYGGKVLNVNTEYGTDMLDALFIRGERIYRVKGDGTKSRIK